MKTTLWFIGQGLLFTSWFIAVRSNSLAWWLITIGVTIGFGCAVILHIVDALARKMDKKSEDEYLNKAALIVILINVLLFPFGLFAATIVENRWIWQFSLLGVSWIATYLYAGIFDTFPPNHVKKLVQLIKVE